jgi:intracellular septation protein A
MGLIKSVQRKEKLKKISHILAGLIILFHAYEKYESEHGSYIYFVVAGVIFLSIALFHHQLKLKFPWVDNSFFAIEAFLSLIIAYDYFHMGKVGLPFIYLFAGLLQLCAIYFFSSRQKK